MSPPARSGTISSLDQRQLFDTLEAIKTALLLNVLIPFKRFLLKPAVARRRALLALAGWRLGGWRLAC
jgi:glycine betaine/proline transport system permease protein